MHLDIGVSSNQYGLRDVLPLFQVLLASLGRCAHRKVSDHTASPMSSSYGPLNCVSDDSEAGPSHIPQETQIHSWVSTGQSLEDTSGQVPEAKTEGVVVDVKALTPQHPRRARYPPDAYLPLIETLGCTLFANDQDMIFEHVKAIVKSSDRDRVESEYTELVLSTRTRHPDPEIDSKLVIAASNAISILHYGGLLGVLRFHFSLIRDWSHIRIPLACLVLTNWHQCNLDYADLSKAVIGRVTAVKCSFKHANLGRAVVYQSPMLNATSFIANPALTFSPNGEYLLAISAVGGLRAILWHIKHPSSAHYLPITNSSGEVSLDLKSDVSGYRDEEGLVAREVRTSFSLDSKLLAVALAGGYVKVFDVSTTALTAEFRAHTAEVSALAFSPDGRWLATSATDIRVMSDEKVVATERGIRLWNAAGQFESVRKLIGHSTGVSDLAFSPDSQQLAGISIVDRSVYVWDIASSTCTLRIQRPFELNYISFSADGAFIATRGSAQTQLVLWDARSGQRVRTCHISSYLQGSIEYEYEAPTLENDSKALKVIGLDSCETCKAVPTETIMHFPVFNTSHHTSCSESLVGNVSRDRSSFATCHYGSNLWIRVHDNQFGVWMRKFRKHFYEALALDPRAYVQCMNFRNHRLSPGGKYLAVWHRFNLMVFEVSNGNLVGRIRAQLTVPEHLADTQIDEMNELSSSQLNDYAFASAEFAPDGLTLATISTKVVSIWDVPSCSLKSVHPSSLTLRKLQFSYMDEEIILATSAPQIYIRLNPTTKESRIVADILLTPDCCYSPRRKWVADIPKDSAGALIRIWEVNSLRLSAPVTFDISITPSRTLATQSRLAYSPDERLLAIRSPLEKICIWDLEAKVLKSSFDIPRVGVSSFAFFGTSKYVIVADQSGTIQVWDTECHEIKGVIQDIDRITNLLVPVDLSRLVITASESTLRFWELDLEAMQCDNLLWCRLIFVAGVKPIADSNVLACDFTGAELSPGLLALVQGFVTPAWRH